MNSYIISSVMAVTAGFTLNTYREYALKRGWPVGKLFLKHKDWIVVFAILSMIGGVVELFYVTSWYYSILLIISSLVLSLMFTMVFKKHVQWIAFLVLIASILVYMIGGAEIIRN